MNTVVVRCAGCGQLSRVLAEAVGLEVACPHCSVPFVARPEPAADEPPVVRRAESARVPVVHSRPRPDTPIRWDLAEQPAVPDVERIPPTGGLIALALLPFGIPLLWLLVSAVARREVIWSFAVPVAVAVGVSGLGFGLVNVNRWSLGARVKAMLALLFLAYLATAFLFIVKREWLQDLRRLVHRGHVNWTTFRAVPPVPPKEPKLPGFSFQYPQGLSEVEVPSPFPNWRSKAYGFRDSKHPGSEEYTAAVARVRDVKPGDTDKWLAAVDAAVREAAPPDAVAVMTALEPRRDPLTKERWDCWQYHFTQPGEVWSRVVRVYRIKWHVFYLAVEGPHLTPDADDVVYFLESLQDRLDAN